MLEPYSDMVVTSPSSLPMKGQEMAVIRPFPQLSKCYASDGSEASGLPYPFGPGIGTWCLTGLSTLLDSSVAASQSRQVYTAELQIPLVSCQEPSNRL